MPYKCRTCGTANPDLYTTCNHPMCPDGRDQGVRPYQMAHNQSPPVAPRKGYGLWVLVLVAVLTALFMAIVLYLAGVSLPAYRPDQ